MGYDLLHYSYTLLRPLYKRTRLHRNVIEEIDNPRLQNAYADCRNIMRTYAKTFYLAARFLPNHKQRSIFAIYAQCRYLDNLVDEAEDLVHDKNLSAAEVGQVIYRYKQDLIETYQGGGADNPLLLCMADVLKSHDIPVQLPIELIEGICTDLTKKRYTTFEELYAYSYKVASTVGLMTSEVFGYTSKNALDHAVELGIAMQLTNILRDLGEDLRYDRIYIPEEDLAKFGLSCQDLQREKVDKRFRELMKFQISRARLYFNRSFKGISMLSGDSRLPVYLAWCNYSRILDQIEKNGYEVFNHRARLSLTRKVTILPWIWWNL
ncbi:MAG: squalene/phytoene synthase family protein [Balneolales bacterium]